jgi:hypothetical protein
MLALSRSVFLFDLFWTECAWIFRIHPLVVTFRVGVEMAAEVDIELTFPTSLCFTLNYMTFSTTAMIGNPTTYGTMMECTHVVVMNWVKMLLETELSVDLWGFVEIETKVLEWRK